jgi:O-antigen ligase
MPATRSGAPVGTAPSRRSPSAVGRWGGAPVSDASLTAPQRGHPEWWWAPITTAVGLAAGALAARGILSLTALGLLIVFASIAALSFRRLEFGLIALLFTLPLDTFGRLIVTPVTVTAFQVVLVICLAAWLVDVARRRASLRFSPIDLAAAMLVLAGLWSLPTSLSPAATLSSLGRIVFMWGFALMYANNIHDEARLRRLLHWLVGVACGLSLLGIAQYVLPGIGIGWVRDIKAAFNIVTFSRVGAFYYDPNTFAGLLAAVLAVCLAMVVHARRLREGVAWAAGAVLIGSTLVLTYSRGGWVCAAAGVIAVILTAPRRRRAWLVTTVLVVAVAAATLAPGVIAARIESITATDTDVSVATRYYMNQSALQIAAAYPVFGTGLGAFDKAYPAFRKPGTDFGIVKPHQLVVALVSEMGIAGLLAEITFAGAVIALYWRKRPKGWGALEAAVLAGLVTLIVGSAFEYYLFFEYLWLFLGLSVVVSRVSRTPKEDA